MAANNNNNNDAAQQEAQVMKAGLVAGQKVQRVMMTKDGTANTQVSAAGCIIPTGPLNRKSPVVLTDAGKHLFDMWEKGDVELRRVLDADKMNQLKDLLVATVDDRNKAEKAQKKELKQRLGEVTMSKAKPCTAGCGYDTKKGYTFNRVNADGRKVKPFPYCHRKDCKEARDEYAARHGCSPAGTPVASPMAPAPTGNNNNNNNVARQLFAAAPSPAKSLSEMSPNELLLKAQGLPEGAAQDRLLEMANFQRMSPDDVLGLACQLKNGPVQDFVLQVHSTMAGLSNDSGESSDAPSSARKAARR
jgi:hypothetical protein